MPVQLLDLPREILNHIFRECHPYDLGKLLCCCKSLNSFIGSNFLLHKEVHQANYDRSQLLEESIGPHWFHNLKRNVRLLKLLESEDAEVKKNNFQFITEGVCELLKYGVESPEADSRNTALLEQAFRSEINLETLLSQSTIFARANDIQQLRSHGPIAQLSAKLHSLYGVPIDKDLQSCTEIPDTYPYAISKVYDLRNYTMDTLWGPFLNDGRQRVDWEMVEAIMIILVHNIKSSQEYMECCSCIWTVPFAGATPSSYVHSEPPRLASNFLRPCISKPKEPEPGFVDPYNITGTWMRIVCFMDYRELFDYNGFRSSEPQQKPLRPYAPKEATRLIIMQLRAVDYGDHGPNDDRDWPVVRFVGSTVPVHVSWDANAHASMRGSVRMTKEGELRWTTFSIYYGEERWRSEGIQLGGIGSARGVIGTWFDKDYDMHGPAGPTAFWKISDSEKLDSDGEGEPQDELPIFGYTVVQL